MLVFTIFVLTQRSWGPTPSERLTRRLTKAGYNASVIVRMDVQVGVRVLYAPTPFPATPEQLEEFKSDLEFVAHRAVSEWGSLDGSPTYFYDFLFVARGPHMLVTETRIRVLLPNPPDGSTVTVMTNLTCVIYEMDIAEDGVSPGHIPVSGIEWESRLLIADQLGNQIDFIQGSEGTGELLTTGAGEAIQINPDGTVTIRLRIGTATTVTASTSAPAYFRITPSATTELPVPHLMTECGQCGFRYDPLQLRPQPVTVGRADDRVALMLLGTRLDPDGNPDPFTYDTDYSTQPTGRVCPRCLDQPRTVRHRARRNRI